MRERSSHEAGSLLSSHPEEPSVRFCHLPPAKGIMIIIWGSGLVNLGVAYARSRARTYLSQGASSVVARGSVLARERFRVKTPFSLFGFVMPRLNLSPMSTLYNCVFCLSLASLAVGQASSTDQISHGMDMNMDMGMSLASGSMLPYLHFAASDILWFEGWVPQNKGAIGGACVGLFMLALFDRWLGAIRSNAEVHWARDAQIELANNLNINSKTSLISRSPAMRMVPPFLVANDISRGLIYGAQTLLGYAFMLAIMTFNAGFLLSITTGLGVGEMLYGRYSRRSNGY